MTRRNKPEMKTKALKMKHKEIKEIELAIISNGGRFHQQFMSSFYQMVRNEQKDLTVFFFAFGICRRKKLPVKCC